MTYLGDFTTGATIDFKFNTRTAAGAPATFSGSPALGVYKNNETTEQTHGLTLTVDFDSRTGLNHVRIDLTQGDGYYAGASDYKVVATSGTVDGQSVAGETVFSFSIQNRSALRPTVAGRALDVSAGGEAGLDWANVGSPTATVALPNTTIGTATNVEQVGGQAVYDSDFTLAAATTTMITLPATDAAGNAVPDNEHDWSVFMTVGGTGINQPLLTTTRAGTRQYNLYEQLTTTLDDTSKLVWVGKWKANAALLADDAQSAADLKDFADAGYDPSTNKVQGVVLVDTLTTYTGNTPQTGDAYARIGATGSGLTSLAPAATALSTAQWTAARAGYLDNVNNSALQTTAAQTGDAYARLGAPAGASVSADVAGVQSDTNDIQSRLPAALVSGRIDASVGAMAANVVTANAIAADAIGASELAADAVGEIADAVWDELRAGHTAAGTFGQGVSSVQGNVTGNVAGVTGDVGGNVAGNVVGSVGSLATQAKLDVNTEVDTALADVNLDHLVGTASGIPAVPAGTYLDQVMDDGTASFDRTTDSLQALRDRGDAAWTTGGGGSITDLLNVTPLLPESIDLADTAVWRLGLMLTNALDDLPSTAEITPGTVSIDRKPIGGTSWSAVVTDVACSEAAGLVYYDEVFDSGSGYAEGDSVRVTFKGQKITVSANDYEVTDAAGRSFYTEVRQTMRGTDAALPASGVPANFAGLAIDGAGHVVLQDGSLVTAKLGTFVLAKTTNLTGLNDLSAAQVNAEADAALADVGLTTAVTGRIDAAVSSRLAPTAAGRTLDVTAGGCAGIDWANVEAPTTVVGLSGTTVKTATDVEADTADIQSRLPAALVGGRIDANVGAISGDATAADNLESYADGTTPIPANVVQISGDSAAADNLEAAADGTGYNLGGGQVVAASVAGNVVGSVGSLATQAKLDVNTEVDTALVDVGLTTTVTGRVDAAVSTRATPAQVNAEVLDVFTVDTFAQPGQGSPPAAATVGQMLAYLYKAFRNRHAQTATEYRLYNDDAVTVDQKAVVSDDGSTTNVGEVTAGP